MGNPRVFLDIAADTHRIGRIEIDLFADIVPKTAENFRCLCTGERGVGTMGKPLHYKGVPIHSITPGFGIHCGDVTNGNGTGGDSIFGTSRFADESFYGKAGRHSGPGCVSMHNTGPDSNGSQFLILTADTPWMNGRHVVVGEVSRGMDVVKAVESLGSRSGQTTKRVSIADCGVL